MSDFDDLPRFYPRTAEPMVRANFIASADGAVTVDGLSAGLQGPGDKEIFDHLREQCDALVVASGTVKAEKYDGLRLPADAVARRVAAGLPEHPVMVVVSGSLDLDLDQLVFADAPVRPIVVTHAGADASRVAEVADVIAVGDGAVDLRAALAALRDRGLGQLLCEGGPHLFGTLIAEDLVDELCLTLSPLLAGGGPGRIAAGPEAAVRRMTLRHVLRRDDMLFLRYARS